jgi:hypothetical protein
MPYIQKMLSLAGRPANESEINKAMEDYIGDQTNREAVPVIGSEKSTYRISPVAPLVAPARDKDTDDDTLEFDDDIDAMVSASQVTDDGGGNSHPSSSSMDDIRAAFSSIEEQLYDIKISEFSAVRELVSGLISHLDQIGNHMAGR